MNPEVESAKGADVIRHQVLRVSITQDGYHGALAYDRAAELVKVPSSIPLLGGKTVLESNPAKGSAHGVALHEIIKAGFFSHLDRGDLAASIYQVDSIRHYREGGFVAYSDGWNRRFAKSP